MLYYLLRHPGVMEAGWGGGGWVKDAGRQPSFTGILLEEIAPQSARQPPPPLICTLRTDPKEQQHPHTHIHTQKKRSHKHKHTLPKRLLSFFPLSFPFFCFFWLTSAANETSRGAGAIWAAQPGCGGAFVGFSVCPGLRSLLRIQKMAPFLLGTSAAPKHISIPSPPPHSAADEALRGSTFCASERCPCCCCRADARPLFPPHRHQLGLTQFGWLLSPARRGSALAPQKNYSLEGAR